MIVKLIFKDSLSAAKQKIRYVISCHLYLTMDLQEITYKEAVR